MKFHLYLADDNDILTATAGHVDADCMDSAARTFAAAAQDCKFALRGPALGGYDNVEILGVYVADRGRHVEAESV